MAEFERDPRLGIAGAFLSVATSRGNRRERSPTDHARGPNKFYRRACLQEIRPLPILAGWEGIDEPKAHVRGWRTAGVAVPSGDPIHMRPTGAYNGRCGGTAGWAQTRGPSVRIRSLSVLAASRGCATRRRCSRAWRTWLAGRSPPYAGAVAPTPRCVPSYGASNSSESAATCRSVVGQPGRPSRTPRIPRCRGPWSAYPGAQRPGLPASVPHRGRPGSARGPPRSR